MEIEILFSVLLPHLLPILFCEDKTRILRVNATAKQSCIPVSFQSLTTPELWPQKPRPKSIYHLV